MTLLGSNNRIVMGAHGHNRGKAFSVDEYYNRAHAFYLKSSAKFCIS